MSNQNIVSHWHYLVENCAYDPKSFYQSIKEDLTKRNIKGLNVGYSHHKTGGLFSGSREYLHVSFNDYHFEIGAAPFGDNGFFVSYWLTETASNKKASLQNSVGGLMSNLLKPETYYSTDLRLAFQTCVKQCVNKVMKELTEAKGLKALSAEELKPQLDSVM